MENSCTNHGIVKGILFIPNGYTIDETGKLVEIPKPVFTMPPPVIKKPIQKKYSKLAKEIKKKINEQNSIAEEYIQEYNDEENAEVCFGRVEAYNEMLDLLREK